MAISAISCASGISVTAVSATSTVRPRATTSDTPITRWPGLGSMTRRTSSSATEKLRVTPVTMASASPSADHAGGEMIAVGVHQPLAIAHQDSRAAAAARTEIGVDRVAGRQPRIDDLDAFAKLDAGLARGLRCTRSSRPTRSARAETLMHEARRRADHLFFLALGEHHALRADGATG